MKNQSNPKDKKKDFFWQLNNSYNNKIRKINFEYLC